MADRARCPIAFAGGLACGAVMLRTGSLAAVIGLHAGWNLGVVVSGFPPFVDVLHRDL
jgi:membrane protease YdiL (CAAX protease family)